MLVGGADVAFSSNGTLNGVTHTAGTAGVTVPNTGIYEISYTINSLTASGAAIALTVNGTVVASTNISIGDSGGSGTAILNLNAGDVITLRNNSANVIMLVSPPAISSQLNILQLS